MPSFETYTPLGSSVEISELDTVISNGLIPIGAVIDWLKTFTGTPATLPAGWVECNGQTLSDADSVYNGEVIPNLNGDNRFMRGNATSGAVGGSSTHYHTMDGGIGLGDDGSQQTSENTNSKNHLPPYYNTVKIMRVK